MHLGLFVESDASMVIPAFRLLQAIEVCLVTEEEHKLRSAMGRYRRRERSPFYVGVLLDEGDIGTHPGDDGFELNEKIESTRWWVCNGLIPIPEYINETREYVEKMKEVT